MANDPRLRYDDPTYLVIRERGIIATAMSASAAGTAFAGSTLKSWTKYEVLGATVVIASGGSVGSTVPKTLGIGVLVGGSLSVYQKFTCTISATTSAAGDMFDLSLSTPMTVTSMGDSAVVVASSASAADHGCVLNQVIWRYRILPIA